MCVCEEKKEKTIIFFFFLKLFYYSLQIKGVFFGGFLGKEWGGIPFATIMLIRFNGSILRR